ncbi:MAG TPA: hypothetical protein VFC86_05010 [Planctomycetota bacterium]|nr:hypothetical protein [Planctomycetota bacterium]
MRALPLIAAALLAGLQDEHRNGDSQKSEWFDFTITDPQTGERFARITGRGKGDHEKATAELTRVQVEFHTRPSQREPSHTIHLFANTCRMENVGGEESAGKAFFTFSDGLRVMVDDEVRLWTSEGTFDLQKQLLKCPKSTRLVRFMWPPQLDLASALAFMDPQEMDWLRLFGAPDPQFELAGEEFEFDAAANVFIAGRKGRIRVKGSPGEALLPGKDKKKPRSPSKDPTELRCEGPLTLRSLGSPDPESWSTLHVTALRDVVIERRTKGTLARTQSDAASIYIGVPPRKQKGDARPQTAVLSGRVRIEESRGFSATADKLEWSHQDDIVRLTGAPLVELREGRQRLVAREVLVDRWTGTVDFKGDILATFLPDPTAPGADKDGAMMTLKPGDLRVRTDAAGRPFAVHARKGVKITTPRGASAADALEADGVEFEWDFNTGEGALRGSPFARIRQGTNLVVAPLVTFQGESFGESLMVIKGPKLMKFFIENKPPAVPDAKLANAALGLGSLQQRPREPALNSSASLLEGALGLAGLQRIPGRRESVTDFVISCDGDAVVDQKLGFVKLVDRCNVRAQDSTLTADRLFVYLADNGKSFDRAIGLGNVRASQGQGPRGVSIRIEGETLEMRQDPATGDKVVTVVGFPIGVGRLGSDEFKFHRMIYNLDTKEFSMNRPRVPFRM